MADQNMPTADSKATKHSRVMVAYIETTTNQVSYINVKDERLWGPEWGFDNISLVPSVLVDKVRECVDNMHPTSGLIRYHDRGFDNHALFKLALPTSLPVPNRDLASLRLDQVLQESALQFLSRIPNDVKNAEALSPKEAAVILFTMVYEITERDTGVNILVPEIIFLTDGQMQAVAGRKNQANSMSQVKNYPLENKKFQGAEA
ncbi:hypothetical protein BJ878DRAFT_480393 [Calycina marina]|uniref:Uncharacterized protein n=1 Tax=Calycina marina TaxID=1763456 RepID=A0A9P7Z2M7_9HELO|nr:hypothetical protein BJ878DRAFT_480393 [Calycina marina]